MLVHKHSRHSLSSAKPFGFPWCCLRESYNFCPSHMFRKIKDGPVGHGVLLVRCSMIPSRILAIWFVMMAAVGSKALFAFCPANLSKYRHSTLNWRLYVWWRGSSLSHVRLLNSSFSYTRGSRIERIPARSRGEDELHGVPGMKSNL